MRTALTAILATLMVVGIPVFAAEQEPGSMMQMQERMQKMQDMMGAIKAEQDPAKRAELMAQHMQEMQEGMRMMGGGMQGRMQGGPQGGMQGMTAEQRMEMMEQRMGMMQMMMGQMMQHEQEETENPAHEHGD